MSAVYNPEADTIAKIERLEMDARELRRKAEHARNADDKRVLNKQMQDVLAQIESLRSRLP